MRALTVVPLQAGSAALVEMPDPVPGDGELLVEGSRSGVCGTDIEIVARRVRLGAAGRGAAGARARVARARAVGARRERTSRPATWSSAWCAGPTRCRAAPARAGRVRHVPATASTPSAGSRRCHGYGSTLWTVEADYAVRLDPSLETVGVLMEPTTIVAKAWDHIERIAARAYTEQQRVLVTGAGPIGLLAALLGSQRQLEVHVLDRVESGLKPELVRDLGATYHCDGRRRTPSATCEPGRDHRGDRRRAARLRRDAADAAPAGSSA